MKDYSVIENKGEFKNQLKWIVYSNRNGVITSHLKEEVSLLHCNRLNKKFKGGLDRSTTYKKYPPKWKGFNTQSSY